MSRGRKIKNIFRSPEFNVRSMDFFPGKKNYLDPGCFNLTTFHHTQFEFRYQGALTLQRFVWRKACVVAQFCAYLRIKNPRHRPYAETILPPLKHRQYRHYRCVRRRHYFMDRYGHGCIPESKLLFLALTGLKIAE
jgi:hypothetical protein